LGKHLQLGTDFGFGRAVLKTNISGTEAASKLGSAVKLSAAYDFDSTATGPALLLGGEVLFAFIEAKTITGYSVFLKMVLK
jgi:hypothetical protein